MESVDRCPFGQSVGFNQVLELRFGVKIIVPLVLFTPAGRAGGAGGETGDFVFLGQNFQDGCFTGPGSRRDHKYHFFSGVIVEP